MVANAFFAADDRSVDVLCLGNSHLNRGIDPLIVEAKTGLRTEMIIGGGLEIAQIYYNLLATLQTQSPDWVIIETYPLIMRNSINNKANNELALKMFGPGILTKYGSFSYKGLALGKKGGDLYDRFSIFSFHDDWTEPQEFAKFLEGRDQIGGAMEFQELQRFSRSVAIARWFSKNLKFSKQFLLIY